LTCRNIFTLNEVNYEALFRIGLELNVPVVKTYDLNKGNMGAILRTFEGMPWSEEGYVVDDNFNRVKVKTQHMWLYTT
jgi:hypothetical protein